MNIHPRATVATVSIISLFVALGATSAKAAAFPSVPQFNFSYSGVNSDGNTITTSGELMTGAYDSATNSYPITGIVGTRNGNTIDSLIPPNGYSNDNLLIASNSVLDYAGFSYSAGGQDYNVYFNINQYDELSDIDFFAVNFSVTPQPIQSVTAVPEPSEIAGVLSMGVLAGGILLQRKLNMTVS
ncbi:MAG: hypothetical protein JO235_25075 [Chroococcidiopsidaceae cyanobacterium CP_BM_RX_35]|nr:hypothetical protein [Chroococcidiopsidaceae cyanobacterium CP_BM_RX_35]